MLYLLLGTIIDAKKIISKKPEQSNQKIFYFIDSFIFQQKVLEKRKYSKFLNVFTKERICSQTVLIHLVFDRCPENWFIKMEKICYYSYQITEDQRKSTQ